MFIQYKTSRSKQHKTCSSCKIKQKQKGRLQQCCKRIDDLFDAGGGVGGGYCVLVGARDVCLTVRCHVFCRPGGRVVTCTACSRVRRPRHHRRAHLPQTNTSSTPGAAFSKVLRKILGKLLILGATDTQVATSSRRYSATVEHCTIDLSILFSEVIGNCVVVVVIVVVR